MFSGIISDLGEVRTVETGGDTRLMIGTRLDLADAAIGASIACSGACLTVIEKGPDWFAAMVSAETMACTTLASWRAGTKVNLERALRLGDEFGGHIVLGHVDGVVRILDRRAEGDSLRFSFAGLKGNSLASTSSRIHSHVQALGARESARWLTSRSTFSPAMSPVCCNLKTVERASRFARGACGRPAGSGSQGD